jgi:hypothetical protein
LERPCFGRSFDRAVEEAVAALPIKIVADEKLVKLKEIADRQIRRLGPQTPCGKPARAEVGFQTGSDSQPVKFAVSGSIALRTLCRASSAEAASTLTV